MQRLAAAQHAQRPYSAIPAPARAVNCATVIGSSSSEEAKIGGMTPDEFSFSGRWDASPWNILIADLALRILHEQPSLRPLEEHDAATTPSASARKNTRTPGEIDAGARQLERAARARAEDRPRCRQR